jgi:hypothetical protein
MNSRWAAVSGTGRPRAAVIRSQASAGSMPSRTSTAAASVEDLPIPCRQCTATLPPSLSRCCSTRARARTGGPFRCVPVGHRQPVELDPGHLGGPAFLRQAEFGDLTVTQQAHQDIHASQGQVSQLVGEPITSPRPGHRAEPPRTGALDCEQGRAHCSPNLTIHVQMQKKYRFCRCQRVPVRCAVCRPGGNCAGRGGQPRPRLAVDR